MTIEMKKVWFDGEKVVTQNIIESDIYKRHWDIASCKAYAEQLRDKNRANTAEHAAEAIEYLLALAQPEQEPVGKFAKFTDNIWREVTAGSAGVPLYTTPPQRTWVGLTDEEILAVNMSTVTKLIDEPIVCDTDHNIIQLGKAIEAKLKQKNGYSEEKNI